MESQFEKMKSYVERIKAQERKETVLQDEFKASEQLLQQVNKKSFKKVYGKAAQYKKELANCKFKLVVYWKCDQYGNFYSLYDKQTGKNRRHIPSIDIITTKEGKIIQEHQEAFKNLMDYCMQNTDRLEKAMLILNDYIEQEEKTIFMFNPVNISLSKFIEPLFKKDEKGNNLFSHLDGNPLRTDKMRFYNH